MIEQALYRGASRSLVDLAIESVDDRSPNRSGLKRLKPHNRAFHGCLAATLCQIHPEIRYSMVEGVSGN